MMKVVSWTGLAVVSLGLACGDSGPGGRGGPGGGPTRSDDRSFEVYLARADVDVPPPTRTSGFGLTRRGLDREGVTVCDLGYGNRGVCLRPTNLGGWAGNINLGGEPEGGRPTGPDGRPVPSTCGPGRLLVVDAFGPEDGRRGGGMFDLVEPVANGGNTALFCDEYRDMTWDRVSVQMAYLDVQVHMIDDFWTLRYIFEPSPLDVDPIFADASCDIDEHRMEALAYLPAPIRVMRGDVLLCRKPTEDAECAHEDFEFLDLNTMTFTSSRTDSVHQLAYFDRMTTGRQPDGSWGDVFCNTACADGDAYCGFNAGGYDVEFGFSPEDRFSLYTEEIDHLDSRHPAYGMTETSSNSEMFSRMDLFRYEDVSGRSMDGVAEALQVVLRFQLEEFLVLPGLQDTGEVEDHSDVELFQLLSPTEMIRQGDPSNFAHRSRLRGWVDVSHVP